MFSRGIVLAVISMILTACSACTPDVTSSTDTSENNSSGEYSWATWDTCSQDIGDHPCNFTLENQHGEEVSLYDFYGSAIILDFSVMWCGPCQSAASEVQDVQDKYAANGLTYITVLMETAGGTAPTVDDCNDWAQDFGIVDAPVLAGDRSMIDYSSTNGWNITSWPTFFFITDDMVIHTKLKGYSSYYVDTLAVETMGE